MKEKPGTKALHTRSLLGKVSAMAIFLLTSFCFSDRAFGQWQQLLPSFGGSQLINSLVYFLDEVGHTEIGFASFWSRTFRTSDGGNTWQELPGIDLLVDMTFKDSLTGWTASGLKTTNGGLTWANMDLAMGPARAIRYVPSTQRLFLSYWDPVSNSDPPASYVSTDQGETWTIFTQEARLNGYAFVDNIHGVIGTTECSILPTDGIMRTSDGGLTWTYNSNTIGCWQPFARKGTSTFFYVSEYDNSVRRSDDFGVTWNVISQLPAYQTGCLKGDLCGNLYAQGSTVAGNTDWMSTSSDNGITWNSIGGPAINTDSRFCIVGSKVFAEGDDGSVWAYNGPASTGPAGTSLFSMPTQFSVSSSNCDTQNITIPFQSLSCYSGNYSLIAASLVSSGSSFQLQSGSIPRQYVSQDSIHIFYYPNKSGMDTATLSLSVIAGGIQIDTNVQIIGSAVRPTKSVALSDSVLSVSSFNCQEADTTIYFVTSGCPNDFDSITGISIAGSSEFTLPTLDTVARKFNLRDSLRIKYNPTASENDTALVRLQFIVAGQLMDTVVPLYGLSTSPQITLTPGLAGSGNTKNVGVIPAQDVSLALTLSSNVVNLIGLDSIVFEVDFDSDMLSFDSAVLAPGWKISSTELHQGQWIYMLVTDTATIPQEMTLALLHFTAYLTKDTVSQVSLASFNGFLDPNKHIGCNELSIAAGNSVTIKADDSCGDALLRNFMVSGPLSLRIISFHPNPASDEITFEIENLAQDQDVIATAYDALGREVLHTSLTIQGQVIQSLPLLSLPQGVYHMVFRGASGAISFDFVKL